MTARDLLDLALENLRRHRLRVFFTTAGVVIAIATFVALLSFAAGSQRWVSEAYRDLGLMTSVNVYPPDPPGMAAADTVAVVPLDRAAVTRLRRIPGVRYAFPFVDFDVAVATPDTQLDTQARALSQEAFATGRFRTLLAGNAFTSESAKEVIVSQPLAGELGFTKPESLVGRRLILSTRVACLDSGLVAVTGPRGEALLERAEEFAPDSLQSATDVRRVMRRELGAGVARFVQGLFERQRVVSDTLTVIGLGADPERYGARLTPVIVPVATGRRFASSGLNLRADPATLLSSLRTGSLFAAGGSDSGAGYPQVTLELERFTSHAAVVDSVEALGFRGFSYAEQFEEIQRFHLYFYAGLGVIGVLALLTAALGIANTLVMSVTERRREIGVLKSLGADEGAIRALFVVEAALIGVVGSVAGILLGWLGTRAVRLIMQAVMSREGMPLYEPFALPFWLVLVAFAFGVLVAVAAGAFPAARAARVDPVAALRGE